MVLRYLSGGESHGPGLSVIVEGFWAGVKIEPENINEELKRRQQGYGRGKRMKIEGDRVEILSGVRFKETIGTPITFLISNKDFKNWQEVMDPEGEYGEKAREKAVRKPRPGHADLAGAMKYNHHDIRNVLERASARETATRVAVGGLAKELLRKLGIEVRSKVTSIGSVSEDEALTDEEKYSSPDVSETRCIYMGVSERMKEEIDRARQAGESLGGTFEIEVSGVPAGLGDYTYWDKKLDGILAGALMSIQGIKGVEIGLGFESARRPGSKVHDEITYDKNKKEFGRKTNNAGGIEGGVSNGENLSLKAAMKPIPTLYNPLTSVCLDTKESFLASVERSDCCAVPACSVVGENVIAWEICRVLKEKFGGDCYQELYQSYQSYLERLKEV